MKTAIFILTFCLLSICSCNFYMSISGNAKPAAATTEQAKQPEPVKEKPKTHYEQLKEEHNKEWLNPPHRDSENELFQPK